MDNITYHEDNWDLSHKDSKSLLANIVEPGDILICITEGGSSSIVAGNVGHAVIIVTDNNGLEMVGGNSIVNILESNNRIISIEDWYNTRSNDMVALYRCPDREAANSAADWAYRNYYNNTGGHAKTVHVNYNITPDIFSTNPSYCSKLVLQAYYFGTGTKSIINLFKIIHPLNLVIVPNNIPDYFNSQYELLQIGCSWENPFHIYNR